MKKCTKCGVTKELSAFAKDKGQSSGLKCACRACFRAYREAIRDSEKTIPKEKRCCRCKEVKPSEDFYRSAHQRTGLFSACKSCENARVKSEEARRSEYWKKYYKDRTQELHLLRKYNITKQNRQDMLHRQGSKCAICGKMESELSRLLVVDHCHNTNKVRGLLCQLCNTGLGAFEDDTARMSRAISYISSGGVGDNLTAHGDNPQRSQ